MTGFFYLVSAVQALAAGLSVALARVRREHRPIAVFLSTMVAANLVRSGFKVYALDPARARIVAAGLDPADVPFTGWVALVAHVDGALFLMWAAGLAALAVVLFLRQRIWPVVAAWAAVSIALGIGYPTIRGDLLRRCYLAIELCALATVIVGVAAWRRRQEIPTIAHLCAWMIAVVDFGSLFVGPWSSGLFNNAWFVGQVMYSALYAVLIVTQGGVLWLPSKSQ